MKIQVTYTKNDIIDGNIIIANYLGLRHKNTDVYDIEDHEYPTTDSFFDNATDTIYHKENLLYHYKWDWLEPVINLLEQKYSIKFEKNDDIIKSWIDVVNFIKSKIS